MSINGSREITIARGGSITSTSVAAALVRARITRINLIGLVVPGVGTMGGITTSTTASTVATASTIATAATVASASTIVLAKAVLKTLTPCVARAMERAVRIEISAGIEVPLASIPALWAVAATRAAAAPIGIPAVLIGVVTLSCGSRGSIGGSVIAPLIAAPIVVALPHVMSHVEMSNDVIDRIDTYLKTVDG